MLGINVCVCVCVCVCKTWWKSSELGIVPK